MEATFNAIPIRKLVLTIYCNTEGRVRIAVFISSLQKCKKKHLHCILNASKTKVSNITFSILYP